MLQSCKKQDGIRAYGEIIVGGMCLTCTSYLHLIFGPMCFGRCKAVANVENLLPIGCWFNKGQPTCSARTRCHYVVLMDAPWRLSATSDLSVLVPLLWLARLCCSDARTSDFDIASSDCDRARGTPPSNPFRRRMDPPYPWCIPIASFYDRMSK